VGIVKCHYLDMRTSGMPLAPSMALTGFTIHQPGKEIT